MNIEFRKATIDDVAGIISLCNECFKADTSVEYARRVFMDTYMDKNQIYLVGIYDGKVIAHTKITIVPMMYEEMKTYAVLNHVCVKPEYRRHNIATLMLRACEQVAKFMNCNELRLWSGNDNGVAHRCYLNFGFEIDDSKFFEKSIR